MKNICVFCGSSSGMHPTYREGTIAFGRALATEGYRLVYGGGGTGLMGILADAVLANNGEVSGVIPYFLAQRERAHKGLTHLFEVQSMHQRKQKMADISDGFVMLPGGMGTLDEFCEIVTWSQLGLHSKPIGILNTHNYFDGFLTFFNNMIESGFFPAANRNLLLIDEDPKALFQQMESYTPPDSETLLNRFRT